MKKILFALFSLMVIIGLAACDEEEAQGKDVTSVETSEDENADEAAEEAEEGEMEEAKEINEDVADNDMVKATLVSVEYIEDKDWDEERYEIKFEVENKRKDTIEVQAREVSTDGKMVDESLLMMSQEISGGKVADAVLEIEDYSGGDLPDMDENLEMILHVFSWDDMEVIEDIDISIDF